MEKNNIGEQPLLDGVQAVATGDSNGTETNSGSPLGKFKNTEALLDAYNELQSEFTRKCQKLSDVEKKLQSNVIDNTSQLQTLQNEFAWDKNIDEFLQSHKYAKNFAEDITKEILNNNDLKKDSMGLEKAYYSVLEKKYASAEDLAKNGEFLDKYIYSNKDIKDKIINEYVSSIKLKQSPIKVSTITSPGVATKTEFTNLEEARGYLENMFKF